MVGGWRLGETEKKLKTFYKMTLCSKPFIVGSESVSVKMYGVNMIGEGLNRPRTYIKQVHANSIGCPRMPRKSVNLNDEEYRQVEDLKHKLNLTDREIYLRGLGIDAQKRLMGRPKKRTPA